MKTFAALLFISAFAAYVAAEEMAFNRAIFQFLDERHDENMAQVLRDQGLPEDTLVASDHPEPPDWIVSKNGVIASFIFLLFSYCKDGLPTLDESQKINRRIHDLDIRENVNLEVTEVCI